MQEIISSNMDRNGGRRSAAGRYGADADVEEDRRALSRSRSLFCFFHTILATIRQVLTVRDEGSADAINPGEAHGEAEEGPDINQNGSTMTGPDGALLPSL